MKTKTERRRRHPVTVKYRGTSRAWDSVNPLVKTRSLYIARGDRRRITILSDTEVIVHNNPR